MKRINNKNKKINAVFGITVALGTSLALNVPNVAFSDTSFGSSSSFDSFASNQSFPSNGSNNSLDSSSLLNRIGSRNVSIISEDLGNASGVTILQNGFAYVTDSGPVGIGTPSKLFKVDLNNGSKNLITDKLPKHSSTPRLDKNGKTIYLEGDGKIQKMNLDTNTIEAIAGGPEDPNYNGTPQNIVLFNDSKLFYNQYSGFGAGTIIEYKGDPFNTEIFLPLGYDPNPMFTVHGNKMLVSSFGEPGSGQGGKLESIDINTKERKTILVNNKYAITGASITDDSNNLYLAYVKIEFNKKGQKESEMTVIDKVNLETGKITENIATFTEGDITDLQYHNGNLIATCSNGKLLRIKI